MQPVDEIYCELSDDLKGKLIVLCITGSIAAMEAFALARELARHGADVVPVLSQWGAEFVTPMSMEFATGFEPVTELDGRAQHVALLGDHDDRADLLLIAPCTANTVSKMANGIDDTTVTTMATIALGSGVPLLVAPAMHLAMYRNQAVVENVGRLQRMGVRFVGPRVSGDKAKVASKEEIVESVILALCPKKLSGRRVLVIGGSSEEAIDDMRVVSNRSTGEMAVELAAAAFRMGATVDLWMGRHTFPVPEHLSMRRFTSVADLEGMIDQVDHDLVLMPAALADFRPVRQHGKLPSDIAPTLELEPVPKLIGRLVDGERTVVGFKAESDVSEEDLVARAIRRLEEHELDAIVANDLGDVAPGRTQVLVVTGSGDVALGGSKRSVAEGILHMVGGRD